MYVHDLFKIKLAIKLHKKIIVLLVNFIHESSRYEYSHYVIT